MSGFFPQGRYKDTLSNYSNPGGRDDRCTRPENQSAAGDWQLIIKLAGARSRRPYRNGTAYEALMVQGDKVFFGTVSSNARTSTGALLEAVIAAKDQGFQHVFFLSDSKSLLQTFKMKGASDWQDSTRLVDLCFLTQNGFHYDVFWVPNVVIKELWSVAKVATHVPMHHCRFSPVVSALL